MTPSRRTIAGGVAAAVLGSGVTAALLLGPGATSASTTPTSEPSPTESEADEDSADPDVSLSLGLDTDALLDALIESGVITEEQAGAIADQLAESMPSDVPEIRISGPGFPDDIFSAPNVPGFPRDFEVRRPGRVFDSPRLGVNLETVAEAIGIDESELREQLFEGATVAEIAESNGVDPQTVIDALVADYTERVTDLVQGDGEDDAADSAEPTEPAEPTDTTETTTSV